MAAAGPVRELCEEASCSICLDFFRDPVTIAECGHNFCRACLARSWEAAAGAEPSCPQCRGAAQEGSLRPNQQLANFVQIAKKFSPLEGKGGACEKRQEPPNTCGKAEEEPLCVACGRSAGEAGEKTVCQKHQEPLKLFCQDDKALICVVCDHSKEHRDHKILPLEEASELCKDYFCKYVAILREEREDILVCKANIMEESKDMLKQTTGEKQETVAKFGQLHTFLEEQEKLLLARIEDLEKEVAKERDGHLARLSEALSSRDNLIREMEEKCQQPAGDLLQDAKSTLQRYNTMEIFENPVTFSHALKWRIWDILNVNLLEGIKKQLKDTPNSGLRLQKANLTLDPDTAHPQLILCKSQKSVKNGEKAQALPTNPKRFDVIGAVLGREGFTAGCHFWEVLVGREEDWAVGVARKSVRRKGSLDLCPKEGFWMVWKWGGSCKASVKGHWSVLSISGELKRIRVCLNYAGGRVAFFDADRAALLCEFSGASFSGETLLPCFWVNKKGNLIIA